MIETKIGSIIVSFLFLGNYFIGSRILKSKLHPSILFSLFWFFFTFIPEFFLFDYKTNLFSEIYIYILSLILIIPAILGFYYKPKSIIKSSDKIDSNKFRILLKLFSIISILTSFSLVIVNGFSLSEILSNFMITSGAFAAKRGKIGIEYGLIGVLNVSTTYVSSAIGGYLIGLNYEAKKRSVSDYLFAFAPALFLMLIESQKLIFIISLGYIMGGLFLYFNLSNKKIYLMPIIRKLLILIIILVPFILISFVTRDHFHQLDFGSDIFYQYLYRDIVNYFLSEIFAFSDFFTYYVGYSSQLAYQTTSDFPGEYTFFSVVKMFGFAESVLPGFYNEVYQLGDLTPAMIFTIFRGVLQDFGIVGSFFVFFGIGIFFDMVMRFVCSSGNYVLANVLYISSVVFILFSYILSLFMARFSFLVALLLYLSFKISQSKQSYKK